MLLLGPEMSEKASLHRKYKYNDVNGVHNYGPSHLAFLLRDSFNKETEIVVIFCCLLHIEINGYGILWLSAKILKSC
jgi:hypothetical protein